MPNTKEIVLFIIGGGLNTLVYLAVALCVSRIAPGGPLIATTVGYMFAVIVSFLFNGIFTFERGDVRSVRQGVKYAGLYALGLVYNVSVTAIVTLALGAPLAVVLIFLTLTWPLISFSISKYVVFR